jgi:hypothetical protein
MKQLCERFQHHEEDQHAAQHKLMLVIILTLLSATGGLIVLTVQSLVSIAKCESCAFWSMPNSRRRWRAG